MSDDFADFLAQEGLPESFRVTLEEVCGPLAERARDWRQDFGRTAMIGLCGAQGSGKSTIAAATVRLLEAQGLRAATLSLDDFYLGRQARRWLADKVHPLLTVRGPPGTHDAPLACAVLDGLTGPDFTPVPIFDKGTDERCPKDKWRKLGGPMDVVILEGWCVGAVPESPGRLTDSVNGLEREMDPKGIWRTYVNRQLAGPYLALFGRLDRLVMLMAPGFEVVEAWRGEQEAKLREKTGRGMSQFEVARFIQHYERLTRWMLEEMPSRADWVIPLDADRTPLI